MLTLRSTLQFNTFATILGTAEGCSKLHYVSQGASEIPRRSLVAHQRGEQVDSGNVQDLLLVRSQVVPCYAEAHQIFISQVQFSSTPAAFLDKQGKGPFPAKQSGLARQASNSEASPVSSRNEKQQGLQGNATLQGISFRMPAGPTQLMARGSLHNEHLR